MERDNNIIEILRKAYTEGYIAGIEGDEPKLGELSERQLLSAIKREYEMDYCNCKNPDLIKLMDEMLTACKGCRKEYLPPQKSDALCGKVMERDERLRIFIISSALLFHLLIILLVRL